MDFAGTSESLDGTRTGGRGDSWVLRQAENVRKACTCASEANIAFG